MQFNVPHLIISQNTLTADKKPSVMAETECFLALSFTWFKHSAPAAAFSCLCQEQMLLTWHSHYQDMSKCFCFWRKISRWTEGWMEMETKAYMTTWHVLSIMPKIHFSFIWMQKIYVKGRICKLPGYGRNLS